MEAIYLKKPVKGAQAEAMLWRVESLPPGAAEKSGRQGRAQILELASRQDLGLALDQELVVGVVVEVVAGNVGYKRRHRCRRNISRSRLDGRFFSQSLSDSFRRKLPRLVSRFLSGLALQEPLVPEVLHLGGLLLRRKVERDSGFRMNGLDFATDLSRPLF